jgi:hypothetical protein
MLKVGGGLTPWPAGQHLVCYQLNQVSKPSLDPYKYPLLVEIKTTHSTCSSPLVKFGLVVVAQVKPCQESKVESSILSSFESSLGDR